MENKTVYIQPKKNVMVQSEQITLKDIASVTCQDANLLARIRPIKIYKFKKEDHGRVIIGITRVIELIEKQEKQVSIECLGDMDIVVKKAKQKQQDENILDVIKICFVSLISFFGTAFTIMAFHNDIGIHDLFSHFYTLIMGHESNGFTALEIAYSLGLAVGIILFFNHIGQRRITRDPTPIEVEMRIYEKDVEDTLIDNAEREGIKKDVS